MALLSLLLAGPVLGRVQVDAGPLSAGTEASLERFVDREADDSTIEQLLTAALRYVEEQGFPLASARVVAALGGDRLELTVGVELSEYVVVSGVGFAQQTRTKEPVLNRLFGPLVGYPFSLSRMNGLAAGLERMGLGALAGYGFSKGEGGYRLLLSLEEYPQGAASGVAAYDPEDGKLVGQFSLDSRNLFGTARTISLYWNRLAFSSQTLRGEYGEPWLLGTPLGGELGGEYSYRDTLYLNQEFFGGLNFPTGPFTFRFGTKYRSSTDILSGLSERGLLTYGGLEMDTRRPFYLPRRGLWFSLYSEGKEGFLALEADAEAHIPAFGLRLSPAASVRMVSGSPVLSFHLYPLGGFGSLMGYSEEQFFVERYGLLTVALGPDWPVMPYGFGQTARAPALSLWSYGLGISTLQKTLRLDVTFGIAGGKSPTEGKLHLLLSALY